MAKSQSNLGAKCTSGGLKPSRPDNKPMPHKPK